MQFIKMFLQTHNTSICIKGNIYTLIPRACGPWALGVHIRQNTCAQVTTIKYSAVTFKHPIARDETEV